MASKRSRPIVNIASALQPILDRLDIEGEFGLSRLMRAWPEIAGETIARRTEVVALRFHTAVIKVSGAMWIQELSLMKTQILARVRETIGDDIVRDIRFIAGRLSRRNLPKPRPVPRAVRHVIELPPIRDPELRRAFERLIEAWGRAER
ncbi:MAG TPA: DUF721 domain-containing protein [Candidatus Binataceae bacterium]|nr:DUF721 domain-containing protein [Candidatus Binataceae bacterium]